MKKIHVLFLSLIIPINTAFISEAKTENIINDCSSISSVQEYKNCLREVIPTNPNYLDNESISGIEAENIEIDNYYQEAVLAFKEDRETDALSNINKFLSKKPNSKEGYFLRGLINGFDFDDAKSALQDLTSAIEIDENYAEAYAWRADIFNYEFSNFVSAENDIKKALKIAPDDPLVNYHAALVYVERAYQFIDNKEPDKGFDYLVKSNFHVKKAISSYPSKLNDIYQRMYPFGYQYELYYELGLNEYEIGWYYKDIKKSSKKAKTFFESAVNSFTLAIESAPPIEKTKQRNLNYDVDYLDLGDLHYWRGYSYASYLKGAWWKKSCKDWKISKKYGNEDAIKEVREYCR